MLKHKYASFFCIVIVVITLIGTVLFVFGAQLGIEQLETEMPYVDSLFSNDRVHTLDIVVEERDWQNLLDNALSKDYIPCNVIIDGNLVKNVGIRTKGNSSLTTIASSDSDRYSFKLEFDQYVYGQTYFGLDKLALNNIIQDNTYLKDYLSYTMMNFFQVDSPLCSFIDITINGNDLGLYLAVEGIEEAFAERNYGSNYGNIYKPEGMNMAEFANNIEMPEQFFNQMQQLPPDGMTDKPLNNTTIKQHAERPHDGENMMQGGIMGSTDTMLIYTDDHHESYKNIFDNAVFDIRNSDKERLIQSLKQLSEGENIENIVNIEEVLRYFVVHNYLLNFDSYTGSMVHNYYLYEKDGQLSMIPWDYNLAFGAFEAFGVIGGATGNHSNISSESIDQATRLVNFPIDTPIYNGTLEERPLLGQLLSDDIYLEQYHELFDEFIKTFFEDGEFEQLFNHIINLIYPYIEKDPTAFCTYEEFLEGSSNLKEFCLLRAESVRGQLNGEIPAIDQEQDNNKENFIDASHINMDVMSSVEKGKIGDINNMHIFTKENESNNMEIFSEEMMIGQFPMSQNNTNVGIAKDFVYLIASIFTLIIGIAITNKLFR